MSITREQMAEAVEHALERNRETVAPVWHLFDDDDIRATEQHWACLAAAAATLRTAPQEGWVSVEDCWPETAGDPVPVWTWDGKSAEEDDWDEDFEQPGGLCVGGWVSVGWSFQSEHSGTRHVTHWTPRVAPPPPHPEDAP